MLKLLRIGVLYSFYSKMTSLQNGKLRTFLSKSSFLFDFQNFFLQTIIMPDIFPDLINNSSRVKRVTHHVISIGREAEEEQNT
jgi:hypothetical protein